MLFQIKTYQSGAIKQAHVIRCAFTLLVNGGYVQWQGEPHKCTRHPDKYRVHKALRELRPRVVNQERFILKSTRGKHHSYV